MKLTVKDLIEYLEKQNPEAKICFYDSKIMDYVQLEDYLFKKVSSAKKDYEKTLENDLSGMKKNQIKDLVEREMKSVFKFVEDDDILIGLKNGNMV